MTVLPMAHSATRITPAPRPPALAARHGAPGPLVEPTDTMNRAVRSLTPPPRSPASQSAPTGGCAPPTTAIAGSTGLFTSERTASAGRRQPTRHAAQRLPPHLRVDTPTPGCLAAGCLGVLAVCGPPLSAHVRAGCVRMMAGSSPGLCHQHPMEVAPDQESVPGEMSRAQPYGSRIRHEDEKNASAILMRILHSSR